MKDEIWEDGKYAVLYSEDLKLLKEILAWKVMNGQAVDIMAEYEGAGGRIFAMQIRFPANLRNRVARRCGLPECKQRNLSNEDKISRAARISKWQFKPP